MVEKKFIDLGNGETYAYIEKGQGDKHLILVHGNVSSSLYFRPLIERLPNDVHVYAVDLRGFGDSTYVEPVLSLKDLADDIYLWMNAKGIEKASMLGWSLGGGVVLEFAAKYQHMLEKLILLNSASHKGYPIYKKDENQQMLIGEVYSSREELATDPVQVVPLLMALKTKNKSFLKQIFNMTIYTVNQPDDVSYDIYLEESLKQRNLVDVDFALASLNMGCQSNGYALGDCTIGSLEIETLHLWGTHDITVPEYMVKDNVDAMKHSTYVKFDQCGHSILVDKPNELTKVIEDFIK